MKSVMHLYNHTLSHFLQEKKHNYSMNQKKIEQAANRLSTQLSEPLATTSWISSRSSTQLSGPIAFVLSISILDKNF